MAICDNEFVPQFIIPSDPETQWEGGDFFEKDRVIVCATLAHSYHLDKQHSIISKSVKVTLFKHEDRVFALAMCNHPLNSSFASFCLLYRQKETSSVYKPSNTFKEIWPIKDEIDPILGRITVAEPINTSQLAIGYDTGKLCIAPLQLALIHLYNLSSHLDNYGDAYVLQKSHHSAITCMIILKHHISSQQYLVSGGADGVVKIWNLA
ncbi:hypothetical protein BY458DRAFT_535135 [Sporodiniella umbellata]|nr:hypothetical protein BY458DRAFT_535135 [Sporodiniella umbellata]